MNYPFGHNRLTDFHGTGKVGTDVTLLFWLPGRDAWRIPDFSDIPRELGGTRLVETLVAYCARISGPGC